MARAAWILLGFAVGCAKSAPPSPSSTPLEGGEPNRTEGGAEHGETDSALVPEPAPADSDLRPSHLEPTEDCVHPEVIADCDGGSCRIPAGCFIMGSPKTEFGRGRYSEDQIQVTLTHAFEVSRTEVTYGMWRTEGFDDPTRNVSVDVSADCLDDVCPIANVNFFDAMAFANRYSENRGLPPCYELIECTGEVGTGPVCVDDGPCLDLYEGGFECQAVRSTAETVQDCPGYRLPTEAEWEYAARGGTKTAFYSGDIIDPSPEFVDGDCYVEPALIDVAWYCHNSEARAHFVGEKRPNPWGLLDVLGNVEEWTTNIFDGLGYGVGPVVDPRGTFVDPGDPANLTPAGPDPSDPYTDKGFVNRGGSFLLWSGSLTAAERYSSRPDYGSSRLGFRLVRTFE